MGRDREITNTPYTGLKTAWRRSVETFDQWKARVDEIVRERVIVGCDDLPDVDYRGLYQTGNTPEEAADFVIQNAVEDGYPQP